MVVESYNEDTLESELRLGKYPIVDYLSDERKDVFIFRKKDLLNICWNLEAYEYSHPEVSIVHKGYDDLVDLDGPITIIYQIKNTVLYISFEETPRLDIFNINKDERKLTRNFLEEILQ